VNLTSIARRAPLAQRMKARKLPSLAANY